MIKLKDILKESAPGFENRQFGDPLPTLADVAKEYQEKNGIQVEEGQKREASNIINKFDKAYLNFAKEVRDVIKMVNRSTGEKTDGKIIDKSYSKHLIQLDKLMQSWSRGQQENPNIDESVVNEAEIRWGAVDNAIIKYIKHNVKVLEKPIKAKDEAGTVKMLKAFIDGLVNAQKSLKLRGNFK